MSISRRDDWVLCIMYMRERERDQKTELLPMSLSTVRGREKKTAQRKRKTKMRKRETEQGRERESSFPLVCIQVRWWKHHWRLKDSSHISSPESCDIILSNPAHLFQTSALYSDFSTEGLYIIMLHISHVSQSVFSSVFTGDQEQPLSVSLPVCVGEWDCWHQSVSVWEWESCEGD